MKAFINSSLIQDKNTSSARIKINKIGKALQVKIMKKGGMKIAPHVRLLFGI